MLPFCGTFGMSAVLAFLAGGATIHVLDTFDAASALRALADHGITHAFGSDEMFRRILALTDAPRPLPQTQVCGFAAFEPGWRELAAVADARGVPLYGLYGSSELQALFSIGRASAPFADEWNAAAGRCRLRSWYACAHPPRSSSHQAWPASSRSNRRGAPRGFPQSGGQGEAITSDGFFRTGDVGQIRDTGSFIYATRAGDAMRLGDPGQPGRIEDSSESFTGVSAAQVVAVEIKGQARCAAFVIPDHRRRRRSGADRACARAARGLQGACANLLHRRVSRHRGANGGEDPARKTPRHGYGDDRRGRQVPVRTARAAPCVVSGPQHLEAGAHLSVKISGCPHAAKWQPSSVGRNAKLRERALGPALRRRVDFAGVRAHADRKVTPLASKKPAFAVCRNSQ